MVRYITFYREKNPIATPIVTMDQNLQGFFLQMLSPMRRAQNPFDVTSNKRMRHRDSSLQRTFQYAPHRHTCIALRSLNRLREQCPATRIPCAIYVGHSRCIAPNGALKLGTDPFGCMGTPKMGSGEGTIVKTSGHPWSLIAWPRKNARRNLVITSLFINSASPTTTP